MKKVLFFAAFMFLCAGTILAAEAKITRDICALTTGREHPSAKGALKTAEDGTVTLEYDFTGGGRYVGVEVKLPAPDMKAFTFNFEAKEKGTRASIIVFQSSGRIETKRRHYGVTGQIAINEKTVFTKPGVEVDGTATKVMFRVEKSTNAPIKGAIVLKPITY